MLMVLSPRADVLGDAARSTALHHGVVPAGLAAVAVAATGAKRDSAVITRALAGVEYGSTAERFLTHPATRRGALRARE